MRVLKILELTKRRVVPRCELDDLLNKYDVKLTEELKSIITEKFPNVRLEEYL